MHFRYRLWVVIGKDKVAAAVILPLAGINHNGLMTNGMSWGGVYADTVKNLCLPVIKLKASAVKLRFQSQNRILIGFIVKRNGFTANWYSVLWT